MASLYTHREQNITKTWMLMTAFLVFVILIGFALSQTFGNPALLYGAVIFSLILNIGSYWYSDKIALSISGAQPITKEQYPDLYNITENLAITAGLPMPRLYIINDASPNAFATGRNEKHAAVAVTTGLLSVLDRTQLEGVIAHELAHIGNKDILLQTVVVILVGAVTMLSDWLLRASFSGDSEGGGRARLIGAILGLALAILSPIIATIIQLAVSRKREFLADATGALLTRYPEGLAQALEKISSSATTMQKANHATAHMFISSPFGPKKNGSVGFLAKMFMTHPPVAERTAALREMNVQ